MIEDGKSLYSMKSSDAIASDEPAYFNPDSIEEIVIERHNDARNCKGSGILGGSHSLVAVNSMQTDERGVKKESVIEFVCQKCFLFFDVFELRDFYESK